MKVPGYGAYNDHENIQAKLFDAADEGAM